MTPLRWAVGAVLGALLLGSCLGCTHVQQWVDRTGLDDYADELAAQPLPPVLTHFTPVDLDAATRPLDVAVQVSGRPPFTLDAKDVTEEVLSFPGRASTDASVARATFFVYRKGPLGQRPVILWLPGNGYGALAFRLLTPQYEAILAAGYDLLVWVPPHHLGRVGTTRSGVFSADTAQNVRVMHACVQEQRTVLTHLRALGTPAIGGWGGSLGAAVLWLTSSVEPLDHLAMMIPVLDWRTVALDPPELAAHTQRVAATPQAREAQSQAWLSISPVAHRTLVPPSRVFLQYGELDQLTPADVVRDFAAARGLKATGYARSHATILLTGDMFEDYADFLQQLGVPLAP